MPDHTAAAALASPGALPLPPLPPRPLVPLAVFGCARDEAALFLDRAPTLGVEPRITTEPLSEANAHRAAGTRCVSVDHRTRVGGGTLRLLRDAGVTALSTRSAGRDHIDLTAARALGITVTGVDYSPDSVADYTLMLMLMAVRGARSLVARGERHDFALNPGRGRELRELTVGVVGPGRIGSAVVDRLRAFGARVLTHDRTASSAELDAMLAQSDVVTLHTPLTAETHHLLDRRRIALLPAGAVVVNTGRGPLLDTLALCEAIESGALGGAALDVLEGEEAYFADRGADRIDDPLFLRLQALPTVLITGHTAYYTERALLDTVTNTILDCLAHERRNHA